MKIHEGIQIWRNARSSDLPVNGLVLQEKNSTLPENLRLIISMHLMDGLIILIRDTSNIQKYIWRKFKWWSRNCQRLGTKASIRVNCRICFWDIFNVNETGLFYNVLQDKTLCFKGERLSWRETKQVTTHNVAICEWWWHWKIAVISHWQIQKPKQCLYILKNIKTLQYQQNTQQIQKLGWYPKYLKVRFMLSVPRWIHRIK
jgi:hypothetical protein